MGTHFLILYYLQGTVSVLLTIRCLLVLQKLMKGLWSLPSSLWTLVQFPRLIWFYSIVELIPTIVLSLSHTHRAQYIHTHMHTHEQINIKYVKYMLILKTRINVRGGKNLLIQCFTKIYRIQKVNQSEHCLPLETNLVPSTITIAARLCPFCCDSLSNL